MAFETHAKNGKFGSRKKFDTEMSKDGWDDGNTEKRDYMKSGRNSVATKAQSNYKFKVGKEAPGNTSRREYVKSGNKAQSGFGTKVS